ncbi:MAG: hypothetical protein QOD40_2903 [Alphaproteobacteria bacterium]|nr:hypothetical protein [Alphaproteobacteria bacterium]
MDLRADVTDPEGYKAYVAADMAAIGKHGGRFLVRGGGFELMEGASRSRSVVIEFRPHRPSKVTTARSRKTGNFKIVSSWPGLSRPSTSSYVA